MIHQIADALIHRVEIDNSAKFRNLFADENVFDGVGGGHKIVFLINDFNAQALGERRI